MSPSLPDGSPLQRPWHTNRHVAMGVGANDRANIARSKRLQMFGTEDSERFRDRAPGELCADPAFSRDSGGWPWLPSMHLREGGAKPGARRLSRPKRLPPWDTGPARRVWFRFAMTSRERNGRFDTRWEISRCRGEAEDLNRLTPGRDIDYGLARRPRSSAEAA